MEISGDPVVMATTAPMAPVTTQRPIRTDLESSILKPYLARGMVTSDMEHPNGPSERDARGLSVLQQHAAFFDQDNDGIIYPWETYKGCRAIGINVVISLLAAFLINVLFSYRSLPGYIPSLLFPIYIVNIHKCKHPSDTGTYDTEGRYLPVNFENMFSKYGQTKPDKLTLRELWNMTEGNRVALDLLGGIADKLEWGILYMVAKDEEGYLSKEVMRGVYDGSVFYKLARKNASKEKKMN